MHIRTTMDRMSRTNLFTFYFVVHKEAAIEQAQLRVCVQWGLLFGTFVVFGIKFKNTNPNKRTIKWLKSPGRYFMLEYIANAMYLNKDPVDYIFLMSIIRISIFTFSFRA